MARRADSLHQRAVVLLDAGGEDRALGPTLLSLVDYVAPNEGELSRLTDGMPTATADEALAAARALRAQGAAAVLVTLGDRGALLVHGGVEVEGKEEVVLHQPALRPPGGGAAVDATAAGDAFRAAFGVALAEGRPHRDALRLGAAAGAIAVARRGAMPSLPRREECYALAGLAVAGAGGATDTAPAVEWEECADSAAADEKQERVDGPSDADVELWPSPSPSAAPPLPLLASRLNSMRARPELWRGAEPLSSVLGLIARQASVAGLSLVELNYPQHLEGLAAAEVLAALRAAGLRAGGVAMRFPESAFSAGALTAASADVRASAVRLAAEACGWVHALNASQLVVWPQFDGYDYNLQVDYAAALDAAAEAYGAVADACGPRVRVSLEFKPTDEKSRFALVPSTGAAVELVRRVGRPNFGLTLDFGHLLMAGENPAQSAALAHGARALFGVQLNDAPVRLGAEDGLAFASAHPQAALELLFWLQRAGYGRGEREHLYFDTFPLREDPVAEAEHNVRVVGELWAAAAAMAASGVAEEALRARDGLAAIAAARDALADAAARRRSSHE